MTPALLIRLHERGAHRSQPVGRCPCCDAERVPTWVRKAVERTLPTRITDGVPLR